MTSQIFFLMGDKIAVLPPVMIRFFVCVREGISIQIHQVFTMVYHLVKINKFLIVKNNKVL